MRLRILRDCLVGVVAVGALTATFGGSSQAAPAAKPYTISRANLAKTASFTLTQTTQPIGGSKVSQVTRVEVKGDRARIELNNPQIGAVTYLTNEQGVFLYIPANKIAQKQSFQGGVDATLRFAFRQVNEQMRSAKKIGTAVVSGQTTDVYKDAATGAQLYIGRNPQFHLPVKMELRNEGGTQTILVSQIKTNISLPDARFKLPAGVKVMEPNGAARGSGEMGLPGIGR